MLQCGVIEVVPDSKSRDQIGKQTQASLREYFHSVYGSEDSIPYQEVHKAYRSCGSKVIREIIARKEGGAWERGYYNVVFHVYMPCLLLSFFLLISHLKTYYIVCTVMLFV